MFKAYNLLKVLVFYVENKNKIHPAYYIKMTCINKKNVQIPCTRVTAVALLLYLVILSTAHKYTIRLEWPEINIYTISGGGAINHGQIISLLRTPCGPNISVCLLRIFARDLFIPLSRRYTTVLPLRIAWNSLLDGTHILYKHVRRIYGEESISIVIIYILFRILYSCFVLPDQTSQWRRALHEGAYLAFQLKKCQWFILGV